MMDQEPEAPRKIDPAQVEVVGVDRPQDGESHGRPQFGPMHANWKVMKAGPWGFLLIPLLIPIFLILFLILGLVALLFGSRVFKVIRYGQIKKP